MEILCGLKTTRRPASTDRTACRQFQATGQPVSRTQASDAMTVTAAALSGKVCATQVLPMWVGPFAFRFKGTELPPANILIPQWLNFFFYLLRLRHYKAKCVKTHWLQVGGRSLGANISAGKGCPLPIYWYHLKGNWLCYNFAADSFYVMKLCSRLFVQYCRNCPKDDKFRYFIPILRKLGAA